MADVSSTSSSGSAKTPPLSFTGIASGIDTGSIVTQLMSIESRPKVLVQQRQKVSEARIAVYRDLTTKLYALKAAADDLRSSTLYSGTPFASSSDPARLTASATLNATPGSVSVVVASMAAANVKQQRASSLAARSGAAYAGDGVYASSATKLTALTDRSGASLGLAAGQTITLQASRNGAARDPATFTVTAASTVEDLRAFMQTSLPGSTVKIAQGGTLELTSPPGEEQAYTGVTLLGPDGSTPLGGAGGIGTTTAGPTAGLGSVLVRGTGTIRLVSSGVPIEIAVQDGQTMTDVAKAINDKNGSIGASVVNGTLRLQARQTGAASAIDVVPSAGVAIGDFDDAIRGQDATGSVDGRPFQSDSNHVTSALAGVTLSIQGTTPGAPVTLTVDPQRLDVDAAVTKLQTFVKAYNDVLSTIQSKVAEKPIRNPKTDEERITGALFGDSGLIGILGTLRTAMQAPVVGAERGMNLASAAGLSTGAVGQAYSAEAVSGKLTLDEKKLRAAFAAGGAGLKTLLANSSADKSTNGLMQRISDAAFAATRVGGPLQTAVTAHTNDAKAAAAQVEAMQRRLDQREQTMRAQFTAMESALAKLHDMGGTLSRYSSSSQSG